MINYLVIFFLTGVITYYGIHFWKNYQASPKKRIVYQFLKHVKISSRRLEQAKEKEIENFIVQKLKKRFSGAEISAQTLIFEEKGKRERIDIDIEKGQLGIEIKLAKSLKKSNERNRLLGQLQYYREKKYNRNNLLLVVVGQEKDLSIIDIPELKALVLKQGSNFLFLQTV